MGLIINRVKYECAFDDVNIIVSSDSNELAFTFKWKFFVKQLDDESKMLRWAADNNVENETFISYEFSKKKDSKYLDLPMIQRFNTNYTVYLLGKSLVAQGCIVEFKPIGLSLSAYNKIKDYNEVWDLFEKIDFEVVPILWTVKGQN